MSNCPKIELMKMIRGSTELDYRKDLPRVLLPTSGSSSPEEGEPYQKVA